MFQWKPALFVLLLFCSLTCLDSEGKNDLTVKTGENATLECYGHGRPTVALLKWEKNKSEGYVFFFRRDNLTENFQDPLFKDRVKMKDEKWKETGDFSVIIENVNSSYSGTYLCYAGYGKRKDEKVLNTTTLKVVEPGPTGGQSGDGGNKHEGEKIDSVGLKVGLSVAAVLFIVLVGFLIYKKCLKQSNTDYQPPADQGIELPEVSS